MKIDLPDTDGGNVISIEVLRQSRYERRLTRTCPHHNFIVDTALAHVQCRDCGAELNPTECLAMLIDEWHRVNRMYENLNERQQQTDLKIQELEAKSKVKCQHCGKFTLRRYN
jgi:ribosomal protein S27E